MGDIFIAALGYPTKTTLTIAFTKGNLSSFLGALISVRINKYYSVLEPPVKGHLTQERQGIQYTTLQLCSKSDEISLSSASSDAFPARLHASTNLVFATCFQCSGKFMVTPLAVLLLLPSVVTILF